MLPDTFHAIDDGWSPGSLWWLNATVIARGFVGFGVLSDAFGRRLLLLAASGINMLGCIIGMTVVCRAGFKIATILTALGISAQLSHTITLGELVPCKHRGLVASFISVVSLPTYVSGPVLVQSWTESSEYSWTHCYGLMGLRLFCCLLVHLLFLPKGES